VGVFDGRLQVVDVLEGLREDEAVEAACRHGIGGGEIADDGRVRVTRIDVEDVAAVNGGSETHGVVAVHHFEDTATNRGALGGEELLDEVAIDRRAAVASVVVAEGFCAADRPEPGRVSYPLQSFPPTKRIGRRTELPDRGARAHETDVIASFAHGWVRGHDQHVMAETGRRVFRVPPPIGEVDSGRQPTFSIVIATYNAAATIAGSIESALAQTLPALEVIVGDDGSTDQTSAALEPYLKRIRYFRQEHRGVAATMNAALELAQGEFFAVLGADDAYLPERLEALASLSAGRPDLDLLCTDLVYEVDGRAVGRFEETCPFDVSDQRTAILDRCFCAAPAMRRAALIRVGGFDASMRSGSDWECAIRLIHSGSGAGLVEETLYRYRIHRGSLTADRLSTLRERIEFLERVGRTQVLADRERSTLVRSVARYRASLALAEVEVALRLRSPGARRTALATARTAGVPLHYRAGALGAALAPSAAAKALERWEARRGDNRLRSPLPQR
jgi:hypothetical protein